MLLYDTSIFWSTTIKVLDFGCDFGPLICIGQGWLGTIDHGPDAAQFGIEISKLPLIVWHILFGLDRVDGTFRNAYRTIDALVGVDYKEVRAGLETVHRAHIYTVSIPTSYASFGHYMSHGFSWLCCIIIRAWSDR